MTRSTELYLSKSKMFSSRIFIQIFFLLLVTEYSKGAECGPGGLCKYGGVCDSNNRCRCAITCNTNSWEVDLNDLYCLPRPGRQPQLFFGICFALAEACERQEDIPLIKYDLSTGRCSASNELNERFCPTPQAFMGPCGGTLKRKHTESYDGGVCLRTTGTDDFRCRCPKGRSGAKCDRKALPSNRTNVDSNTTTTKIIGVSIGASVVAALLVCALIRRCRQRKCKRANQESAAEEGITNGYTDKPQTSNRAEDDFTSTKSLSTYEIASLSETKSTSPQTTKTKITAETEESPRRKRLTGYSTCNSEDTNNNFGATQPMISRNTSIANTNVGRIESSKLCHTTNKTNVVQIV